MQNASSPGLVDIHPSICVLHSHLVGACILMQHGTIAGEAICFDLVSMGLTSCPPAHMSPEHRWPPYTFIKSLNTDINFLHVVINSRISLGLSRVVIE